MNEASPAFAGSGSKRALAIVIITCLALSAWGIVHTRRPMSGLKRAPAPAPLKPQSRELPTWSLDPEPVCLLEAHSARAKHGA